MENIKINIKNLPYFICKRFIITNFHEILREISLELKAYLFHYELLRKNKIGI